MASLSKDQLNKLTCKAQRASKIIKPLQAVEITGVFYERIYHDGSAINIANDKKWTQLYFDKIAANAYSKEDVSEYYFAKPGISLSIAMPKNKPWLDAQYYFGHGNGVTLIEDHRAYREIIGFYTENSNHRINDFYINNIDVIKQLKQYFILKASNMIQDLEQERLDSLYQNYNQNQWQLTKPIKTHERSNFINSLTASFTEHENNSKNMLLINKQTKLPIYLAPQRARCLTHLTQGKTSKEIAKLMKLSPRTVENYIAKLKHELNCKTSKELIANYAQALAS